MVLGVVVKWQSPVKFGVRTSVSGNVVELLRRESRNLETVRFIKKHRRNKTYDDGHVRNENTGLEGRMRSHLVPTQ